MTTKQMVLYRDNNTGQYISHDQFAIKTRLFKRAMRGSTESTKKELKKSEANPSFRRIEYEFVDNKIEVLNEGRDPISSDKKVGQKFFTDELGRSMIKDQTEIVKIWIKKYNLGLARSYPIIKYDGYKANLLQIFNDLDNLNIKYERTKENLLYLERFNEKTPGSNWFDLSKTSDDESNTEKEGTEDISKEVHPQKNCINSEIEPSKRKRDSLKSKKTKENHNIPKDNYGMLAKETGVKEDSLSHDGNAEAGNLNDEWKDFRNINNGQTISLTSSNDVACIKSNQSSWDVNQNELKEVEYKDEIAKPVEVIKNGSSNIEVQAEYEKVDSKTEVEGSDGKIIIEETKANIDTENLAKETEIVQRNQDISSKKRSIKCKDKKDREEEYNNNEKRMEFSEAFQKLTTMQKSIIKKVSLKHQNLVQPLARSFASINSLVKRFEEMHKIGVYKSKSNAKKGYKNANQRQKNRDKIRSVEYIVARDIFECELEFYDDLVNEHKDFLNVKEQILGDNGE